MCGRHILQDVTEIIVSEKLSVKHRNVLGVNRPLCIYFRTVNNSDYWKSVRNVEFNGGSAIYRDTADLLIEL